MYSLYPTQTDNRSEQMSFDLEASLKSDKYQTDLLYIARIIESNHIAVIIHSLQNENRGLDKHVLYELIFSVSVYKFIIEDTLEKVLALSTIKVEGEKVKLNCAGFVSILKGNADKYKTEEFVNISQDKNFIISFTDTGLELEYEIDMLPKLYKYIQILDGLISNIKNLFNVMGEYDEYKNDKNIIEVCNNAVVNAMRKFGSALAIYSHNIVEVILGDSWQKMEIEDIIFLKDNISNLKQYLRTYFLNINELDICKYRKQETQKLIDALIASSSQVLERLLIQKESEYNFIDIKYRNKIKAIIESVLKNVRETSWNTKMPYWRIEEDVWRVWNGCLKKIKGQLYIVRKEMIENHDRKIKKWMSENGVKSEGEYIIHRDSNKRVTGGLYDMWIKMNKERRTILRLFDELVSSLSFRKCLQL